MPQRILLPSLGKTTGGLRAAPRLDTLRGKTVGFVDNGWWSFGVTCADWQRALVEQHGVKRVVTRKKPSSTPLPPQEIDKMAAEVDAVIVGLGN